MPTENHTMLNTGCRISTNPGVSLQVEDDGWGILYKRDIDFSLGVNPESVFLWKAMEQGKSIRRIADEIRKRFSGVPEGIEADVVRLIDGFSKIDFVRIVSA